VVVDYGPAEERLTSYEYDLFDRRRDAINQPGRRRVPREPWEDPPKPKPAEVLESAHVRYAIRSYLEAIRLAREVEERTEQTALRADALRVRAMAHAAVAEWIYAMEAATKALELEPDGESEEVTSAELPALIEDWREKVIARASRSTPPYGGLIS
jgi:hypothetical protein